MIRVLTPKKINTSANVHGDRELLMVFARHALPENIKNLSRDYHVKTVDREQLHCLGVIALVIVSN
jgi:hypothetical protein